MCDACVVASTLPDSLFCAGCWRRHLVWLSGLWMKFPGQGDIAAGRQAWYVFVCQADNQAIWQAWCSIPEEIRKQVDNIDRRPLALQVYTESRK